MASPPLAFGVLGPSRPYSPKITDAGGVLLPAFDTIPSVNAEGPALAALAMESGGNLASLVTKQTAANATLAAIQAAIQAQLDLTDLFVMDPAGSSSNAGSVPKYYVRRESVNEGTGAITVAFLNLDGSTPTTAPTVANLTPVSSAGSGSSITIESTYFDVTTAGTGYATTDVLARVLFVNTSTMAIVGSSWQNLTQGTTLASAPPTASIAEQTKGVIVGASALPAGAAADGTDATGITAPTGGVGIRGWLSGSYGLLKSILTAATGPTPAGTNVIGQVLQGGSLGTDFSANKPTLPNVGAAFAASGPYASYVLIATVPANPTRANLEVQNISGQQIALVRDDGTAASASPPQNASVFPLAAGAGVGAEGAVWDSATFKGRLQIYALAATAVVTVMQD